MESPPDWFWAVIEETKPSLRRLAEWLESASQDQIEEFALAYKSAAVEVCDFWDGPKVDGEQYSEDDTEDLCNWTVSQGRSIWTQAVSKEIDLAELARLKSREDDGESTEHSIWTKDLADERYSGYWAPEYLAFSIYERRFGTRLSDRLEK